MKYLQITIIFFITLLSTTSFGQGWERIYEAPVDSFGSNVTADKMANGNIAVYNGGFSKLLQIEPDNNPLWLSMPVADFPDSVNLHQMISTTDNSFVVTGTYRANSSGSHHFFGVKLDANLDTIWTAELVLTQATQFFVQKSIELSDSNILILLYEDYNNLDAENEIKIIKINHTNGNIIWTKTLSINPVNLINYSAKDIIENPDGTLMLMTRVFRNTGSGTGSGRDFRLTKISSTGNIIWEQIYTGGFVSFEYSERTLARTPSGEYIFCTNAIVPQIGMNRYVLIKTDTVGNEILRVQLPVNHFLIDDVLITSDNHILICGTYTPPVVIGIGTFGTSSVMKLKMDGSLVWHKMYSGSGLVGIQGYGFSKLFEVNNNEFVAVGMGTEYVLGVYLPRKLFVVKMDSVGNTFSSFIEGNVFNDQNTNCVLDNAESNLNMPTMLQIIQGTDTTYNITDTSGHFSFGALPGNYQLNAIPLSPYWNSCTSTSITLNVDDTTDTDLGLQPIVNCSDLRISINTLPLVSCENRDYYVQYTNLGTQAEPATYVEIEFDSFLVVNNASIPYTQNGSIYTFFIGNLNILEHGNFTVNVTVSCNAVLGQTHCVDAAIYPNQACVPNGLWQGANIVASAYCSSNDSVTFKLENIGLGDMTQSRNYYVIEDQVLPLYGTYQLISGADTTFTIAATGYAYQIQAQQELTYPYTNNSPTAVTYGCNSNSSLITNAINQFSVHPHLNAVDVDCQQNVSAINPNNQGGFLRGYGTENYISQNDEIEYMIHFQNTRTVTAYNLRIESTIDLTTLDLSTLQVENSSHNYEIEIEDGNKLVFNFNNIMLPDPNSNEPESNGFIRFKISQKANNPIGTVIENDAAIYVDFNEPVITNTTFHTVGENFIQIVSTKPVKEKLANVKIFPNPFTEQTTFEIETKKTYQNLTLTIYNVMGQAIKTVQSNGDNQMILDRDNLISGVYFYQIQAEGLVLDSGKLMVR